MQQVSQLPEHLYRLRLCYLSSLITLLLATPLSAQEQRVSKPQVDEKTEVITVTGSRIRRTDLETHTPVVSISAADIAKTGAVDINQLLNQLPSMVPASSSETSNARGYAGTSTQDLRGLGANRTLVLVNGRRHVPSIPGTSVVDMSSIPVALIERVDVLTGGASSVYGADAIAGVINVILKKNFSGTSMSLSNSGATAGDGQRWYGTLTHGAPFADGNGGISYHVSAQSSDIIEGRDRSYIANDLTYIENPLYVAGSSAEPRYITGRQTPLYSTSQRNFLMNGRPYAVRPDSSIFAMVPNDARINGTSTSQLAALSVTDTYGQYYSRYEWARLAVPSDKLNLNLNLDRELSNNVRLDAELKYVRTDSESRTSPLVEYGVTRLPANYAFYTPEQQAEVQRTGQGLLFGGYFPEMGRMGVDYQYDLYQAVVGLEGDFANDFRWQASAQHGSTKVKTTTLNDYSQENWTKAVWGSYTDPNSYENRSCDQTCVPINVFQPLTAEAIGYLKLGPHTSNARLTQSVLAAGLDGDVFELPAGALSIASGLEHRREKSEELPSAVELAGLGANNYRGTPLIGDYHVSEAFVELRVPLLAEVFMAEQLSLNTAWRAAKYNLAGTNHSWTVGIDWTPIKSLKLRASNAKAVRAPNITEVYQSASESFNYIYEVCYSAYRNRGSEYREANCNAVGKTNPANYYHNAQIVQSGNKDLKAERAYTFTAGMVFSPEFIDNLNLTADYWDVDLNDKIGTLQWDQVYPNCMDSPSLDNVFCTLIEENPQGMQLNLSYLNLAKHKTRGIDYALDYHWVLPGNRVSMALRSDWSRLLERTLQSDPASKPLLTAGQMAFPKWRGTSSLSLAYDKFSSSISARYIGSQKPDLARKAADYSVTSTGRLWYLDLGLNYQLTPQLDLNLYLSNLTDRQTPQVPGASTGGASWEMGYTAGLYSTIGRYYTVGLNYQF